MIGIKKRCVVRLGKVSFSEKGGEGNKYRTDQNIDPALMSISLSIPMPVPLPVPVPMSMVHENGHGCGRRPGSRP
jgi:hypothetical protein